MSKPKLSNNFSNKAKVSSARSLNFNITPKLKLPTCKPTFCEGNYVSAVYDFKWYVGKIIAMGPVYLKVDFYHVKHLSFHPEKEKSSHSSNED